MLGGGGEILVGIVGKDVLSRAVAQTTQRIFGIMESHVGVDEVLARLDMRARLETVEALMRDLEKRSGHSESVTTCLRNLHAVVDELHADVTRLKASAESDDQRYFNNWRYVSYGHVLQDLERHSEVLRSRFDMLVNVARLEQTVERKQSP